MPSGLRSACAAMVICLLPPSARADWPTHLIKATIPFGAGSATDVVPRLVFDRLSAELGQPIVVENRAGAGGVLGSMAVAKSEPDGYSVLAHSSALTIAPAIFKDLSFDPTKDLSSVLMIGASANVMIVPMARPWRTIQDFLAAAKTQGAQISFGSVGIGSAVHISAEKFRLAGGFDATHIPYRGGPEVIADILGGRIDFYFCPLATALPLIREGQVRALLVASPQRAAELPDVPIPADIGLKDAESASWFGIFVPAKTPREIIDKMHDAGMKVLAQPQTQDALKRLGVTPNPMTPVEMDALVARDAIANKAVIQAAGIRTH